MSAVNVNTPHQNFETEEEAAGASEAGRGALPFENISRFLDVSIKNIVIEPVVSLIFAISLWQLSDQRQIGIWLALVWASSILRALISLHIRKTSPPVESLGEWAFTLSAATSLAGAIWASGVWFLWPMAAEPSAVPFGIILVVALMATAGIVTTTVAAYIPAAGLYLMTTSIVATICLFSEPGAGSGIMAVIALWISSLLLAALAWWINRLHTGQGDLRIELDAMQEEAKAAHLAKSNFVANISHELRTPLNAINGFAEIIKDQAFGPVNNEQYLEYANDIYLSGNRLLDVINDILALSNLETGKMTMAEERVDVREVVRTVINGTQAQADEAGVTLQKIMSDSPIYLHADRRLLKQILSNLVTNAVKFTPLGGEVAVEVKLAPNDDLMMIVDDNGIGMSPEDIATAKVPFGQVDTSLARRFEGTGLGIPLVNSLVELHGGTLRLQSELSVGTRAIATFPSNSVQH
jgi:two-component system, cell cycle sensor histidine kinase PleC